MHTEPEYTSTSFTRMTPMYAKGYRFVVLSPGNFPVAHCKTEKEAQHDADSRNVRPHG
jgi:hypothetical protein